MPPSPTSTSSSAPHPEPSSSPARVLLYRLGSLGDTVVALPSFHLVARAFPHAERRLLTNFPVADKAPPAAAILEGTRTIHGYLRYTTGTRSPVELAQLWWQIVRWRPDALVYLAPARGLAAARRDARFFRACGIRRLIGVPLTGDMQSNLLLPDPALGHPTHEPEASRLSRNLAELGSAHLDDPASWDLHLTEDERSRADTALGSLIATPFIAVSVGTKVQSKDWGHDNWRALLASLPALYSGFGLALAGAPGESAASEAAAQGWQEAGGGPVINLCGKLTPRESAAAFRRARLFVGHDSGPMHLAAAVQVPCVAIFAARNKPRVWFPYGSQHRVIYHQTDCWGCGLETCVIEHKRCLTSITVDEVLHEIRAVLDHNVRPSLLPII